VLQQSGNQSVLGFFLSDNVGRSLRFVRDDLQNGIEAQMGTRFVLMFEGLSGRREMVKPCSVFSSQKPFGLVSFLLCSFRLFFVSKLFFFSVACRRMLLLSLFVALSCSKVVYMTVLFCPTLFSSRGAVVSIDTVTGNFSVVGKPFKWPIGDSGECSIMASPTVFFDRATNRVYLDFFSAFGKAVVVDVLRAEVVATITPKDPFFIQYIDFYVGKTTGIFGKTFLRFFG
jgi:hypothetical protein